MENKKIELLPITNDFTGSIRKWMWDDMRSFTFVDGGEKLKPRHIEFTYFISADVTYEPIGYVCYCENIRIPSIERSLETLEMATIHFGVRPDLKNTDIGVDVLKNGLKYMSSIGIHNFRAMIPEENEAVIKVYESAGFFADSIITGSGFDGRLIVLTGKWDGD